MFKITYQLQQEPSNQKLDIDVDFVREDQYSSITPHTNCSAGFKPYMIKKIINKNIPESMTGFGSLPVYNSFGFTCALQPPAATSCLLPPEKDSRETSPFTIEGKSWIMEY